MLLPYWLTRFQQVEAYPICFQIQGAQRHEPHHLRVPMQIHLALMDVQQLQVGEHWNCNTEEKTFLNKNGSPMGSVVTILNSNENL